MAFTTSAAPILPGKTEQWKDAVAEINGPRRAAYEASRRALGVAKEVASLQQTPAGDFAVVFIEGDDPGSIVSRIMASDDPFDRWFTEAVLKGSHGMTADELPPPNPVFLTLTD